MIVINARFLTQRITGVQRFAIEISLELKKSLGSNVCFVTPHNILHKELAQELDVNIIGRRTGHLWEQWDLPNYLKSINKPLLINLANTGPAFYKNKIVTIHDVAYEVFPQTYSKRFLILYKFLTPQLMRTSKHVLTVSQFSKSEIQKYYYLLENNISVIYNAVSSEFLSLGNSPLKSDYNYKYFLTVASINYRKNLLFILKAFKKFSINNPNVFLYVIGDIKNESFQDIDLSAYIKQDRIKILGRVSDNDLVNYYRNALAFIFASLYEGFGIPPLEAQSLGCPVLLSDSSCFIEIFGNSARLFNPSNIAELISGMNDIANNDQLRHLLSLRGIENAKRFSWRQSVDKLIDILKVNVLF